MRVESESVDSCLVSNAIEIRVARLNDALVQRNVSMHLKALVEMSVETGASRAVEHRVFVDAATLETRQRHNRLECGTRRPLRLDGPVEQRIARIVGQFLPVRST